MVTNAGGGYSRWGDFELTRWRADRTATIPGAPSATSATWTGRCGANTYQPVGGRLTTTRPTSRWTGRDPPRDHGIETETEMVVAPEDDVEIRRITLINRSARTRRLEVTSYIELALAPHEADRQHPAFNKLFIETEALPEQALLLAHRRPRDEHDPPILWPIGYAGERRAEEVLRIRNRPAQFIGRGRTSPARWALDGLGAHAGYVLDPILSLRRTLELEPGQRVQLSLVLAAGETREQVLRLMDKYGDPLAIERAMEVAWASAQLELRLLRIQPDEARRFQQAGQPHALSRPGSSAQAGTHREKPEGPVRPVALRHLRRPAHRRGHHRRDARDLGLVRQVLQAHTYWRLHGLKADLVILNEESEQLRAAPAGALETADPGHSMHTGVDQPGGVFLRSVDQIPEEDVTLLLAAGPRGAGGGSRPLAPAAGRRRRRPEMPGPAGRQARSRGEPSARCPSWTCRTSTAWAVSRRTGGSTPSTSARTSDAGALGQRDGQSRPSARWSANPASGFTWYGNSQRNRLTPWSNDPVLDPPSEAIYIRDEETGVVLDPDRSPIREPIAYRVRHGAGYTVFEHNSHAIEQELTVFVPVDEDGGEPVSSCSG